MEVPHSQQEVLYKPARLLTQLCLWAAVSAKQHTMLQVRFLGLLRKQLAIQIMWAGMLTCSGRDPSPSREACRGGQ